MGGYRKLKGKKDGVPFTKNDSRINRSGRPKKLPELDALLAEVLGEDRGGGVVGMKKILLALRKKAEGGDVRASELLMDRGYGKLKVTKDIDMSFEQFSEVQLDAIIKKLLNTPK